MIDCGGAIILSHSELHSQNLMAHKFLLSLSGLTAHTIEFHSCIMLIMLNVFNIQPLCTYVLVRVTVVRNFPALTDWTVSRPEVHNSNVHLCESQYGASRWTNSLSLCYSLTLLWYKCAHYLRAHQHYPVAPTECDNKGPATQNVVCRSGLRSLSAAECYILSRLLTIIFWKHSS